MYRPGCNKNYKESDNNALACKFHSGKPIFHDLKKGWACCDQVAYEWDEFEKIVGCCTGKMTLNMIPSFLGSHSDVKQDSEFWKSSTVENASNGIHNIFLVTH